MILMNTIDLFGWIVSDMRERTTMRLCLSLCRGLIVRI